MKVGDSNDPISKKQAIINLKFLASSLEGFKDGCGRYPTEAEGLKVLVDPGKACPNFKSRISGTQLVDPWGVEFTYRPNPDGHTFEITSYGRDKVPGGQGIDRDIRWSENR